MKTEPLKREQLSVESNLSSNALQAINIYRVTINHHNA